MTVSAASGAQLFIGTTTAATLQADFEADSYTEVGEVEDLGEFGDESEQITFTSLSDSRTQRLKGPRDAGVMNIVVGSDMSDTGQAAMEAAEGQALDYNFKVVLNDAITLGGNGSIHYFRGMVFSKRRQVGNASNVIRQSFTVGINTSIISVDPT